MGNYHVGPCQCRGGSVGLHSSGCFFHLLKSLNSSPTRRALSRRLNQDEIKSIQANAQQSYESSFRKTLGYLNENSSTLFDVLRSGYVDFSLSISYLYWHKNSVNCTAILGNLSWPHRRTGYRWFEKKRKNLQNPQKNNKTKIKRDIYFETNGGRPLKSIIPSNWECPYSCVMVMPCTLFCFPVLHITSLTLEHLDNLLPFHLPCCRDTCFQFVCFFFLQKFGFWSTCVVVRLCDYGGWREVAHETLIFNSDFVIVALMNVLCSVVHKSLPLDLMIGNGATVYSSDAMVLSWFRIYI